jgi:hypothetical protein
MVTKIFPSDNEPPKKKRGGGTFFLTTISLPKAKETRLKATKWGFLNHNFTPQKEKRAKNSQSEPKFPSKFPSPFLQRETTLHRLGQGEPTTTVGYLDPF